MLYLNKIKYISRELLGFILFVCFFRFITPKKINVLSIYFHDPDQRLFARLVNKLQRLGYQFISIYDFETILTGELSKKKYVLITFDDGWVTNIKLLDIINQYAVPVTFFVPPDAILDGNFW